MLVPASGDVNRIAIPIQKRCFLIGSFLVLRKALSVCGTEDALVRRLDISKAELRGWLAGKEVVPLAVFNRTMHLVNRAYGG